MNAHASLCDGCGHLASRHGLLKGAEDVVKGPYRCRDCPCEITQESPLTGLTKGQYEEWARVNRRYTWDYERAQARTTRAR